MVVNAADDDGVDLYRVEAKFLREADALQDLIEAVTARDLPEVVGRERIQAKADAVEAGGTQRAPLLLEKEAVGGHCQVGEAGNCRDARDQVLDVMAQERFPPGQPDLLNAEADCKADDALNLLEGKDVRSRDPLLHDGRGVGQVRPVAPIEILRRLGFGQAIEAAEIAAVREAHPQVAQDASVRIDEQPGLGHLAGGLVAAGRLVRGGMTLTDPSAVTSTLRS